MRPGSRAILKQTVLVMVLMKRFVVTAASLAAMAGSLSACVYPGYYGRPGPVAVFHPAPPPPPGPYGYHPAPPPPGPYGYHPAPPPPPPGYHPY
jgi:hypothetical protein